MIQLRRIAVWAGAIVLAVAFVAVGASKLAGTSGTRWSTRFADWGYPANASYVVGVVEIIGGLGMLFPRWRQAASLTLAAVMVGALATHLVHAEFQRVIPPLVLGGWALLMYWSSSRAPRLRKL